jgi:hypothetical protein
MSETPVGAVEWDVVESGQVVAVCLVDVHWGLGTFDAFVWVAGAFSGNGTSANHLLRVGRTGDLASVEQVVLAA